MHDDCRVRFPLGSRVQLETLSRDPYPVLKALQEDEPVSWVPEAQAWFVTRRAGCLSIIRNSVLVYSILPACAIPRKHTGARLVLRIGLPPLPRARSAALLIPRMQLAGRICIRGEREASSMQEHEMYPFSL